MGKKAFTLIELILVVIIIGILASIAVPAMMGVTDKAINAEALTMLGAIRSTERMYYAEYNRYTGTDLSVGGNNLLSGYLKPEDLNGLYFSQDCYSLGPNMIVNTFVVQCKFNQSSNLRAPQADKVNTKNTVITMDQDGIVTYTN